MRAAAACPRKFIFRAEGGVICRWACGAEVVSVTETAVDVYVLVDRFPQSHRHQHHLHGRWRREGS